MAPRSAGCSSMNCAPEVCAALSSVAVRRVELACVLRWHVRQTQNVMMIAHEWRPPSAESALEKSEKRRRWSRMMK
eukprot:3727533-Pleurochrysis_carterae.AAC.2